MSSIIDQLERGGGKAGDGGAIAAAAKRIGCEEAVLEAILEVESSGDAYDQKGRLIILPEKHVFWRELPKSVRAKARALGLAAPKWSRSNYSGLGGKGSDKRWQRLRAMVDLHEEAGLKSASYAKPQIMGFNYKLAGYDSVTSFVLALAAAEEAQDEAFIRILVAFGLTEELRAKDWRAIARRYNGSGQVARYAAMMQAAYARLTAGAPVRRASKRATRAAARGSMLRLGSDGYKVKALQERLCALGYHVAVDGDFGPATRRAVVAFQADHGLQADGLVGPKTEASLEAAVPLTARQGESRADMMVSDLRKRGSQTVKQADRLTLGGIAALLFGSAGELGNIEGTGWLGFATEAIAKVKDFAEPVLGFARDHPGLAIVIAGAAVFYIAHRIKQRRLSDAMEWRHVG